MADIVSDFGSTRQPGRLWLVVGGVTSLAFLFYGSLVPLHFEARPFAEAWHGFVTLTLRPLAQTSRTDLATNFLLTVPLAFFGLGALSGRARAARTFMWSIIVWIGCAAASMSIEFAQFFFPGRTPSGNDILMQSLGAGAGILAWWIWGRRQWGRLFAHASAGEPMALSEKFLWAYLILLFGYNVLPLDLAVSPVEIYHKWSNGGVNLIPFGYPYKSLSDMAYDLATDIAIWVPSGLLLALTGKRTAFQAWRWSVLAAFLLEVVQLFVFSRHSDITDVLTAALGSAIGVMAARRIGSGVSAAAHKQGAAHGDGGRYLSQGLVLFALWTAILAAAFWFPYDFVFDRGTIGRNLSQLLDWPFATYYQSTEFRAATEALRKLLIFVPLGGAFAWSVQSPRFAAARGVTTAAAILLCGTVAVGIELGQVLLPSHFADSGDVIFETLGGMLGFLACGAVLRHRRPRYKPSGFRRQRGK